MARIASAASFVSAVLLIADNANATASFGRRHSDPPPAAVRRRAQGSEMAGGSISSIAGTGTCQIDSPTWSSNFGSCQTYAPGAVNHQYCVQDNAVAECPVACSQFTGPGFDVASVVGSECTSEYCATGTCESIGEGEGTGVLCQCGAVTTHCLTPAQPCITMDNVNGTCTQIDSDAYASVGLECSPIFNVTELESYCQAEWDACVVAGVCSYSAISLSTPLGDIWKSGGNEQQALLLCGYIQLAAADGQNICRSVDIGLISRTVLDAYCSNEIAEGQLSCPSHEHYHCCSCRSTLFPLHPDSGHCCSDCQTTCAGATTLRNEADDRCYGVVTGDCNPLDLVVAMEELIDAELISSSASNATQINMYAFCACRTLVDKLRFQELNITGDDCVADDPLIAPQVNISAGGICTASQGTVLNSTACSFPFTFNGVTYQQCTADGEFGAAGLWCSTESEFDGNWGYCECSATYSELEQTCPSEVVACVDDSQCLALLNAQLEGEPIVYASYFTTVEDGYIGSNFMQTHGTLEQCYTSCANGTWPGCVGFSRPLDVLDSDEGGLCSWVTSFSELLYDDTMSTVDEVNLYTGMFPALAVLQCWIPSSNGLADSSG